MTFVDASLGRHHSTSCQLSSSSSHLPSRSDLSAGPTFLVPRPSSRPCLPQRSFYAIASFRSSASHTQEQSPFPRANSTRPKPGDKHLSPYPSNGARRRGCCCKKETATAKRRDARRDAVLELKRNSRECITNGRDRCCCCDGWRTFHPTRISSVAHRCSLERILTSTMTRRRKRSQLQIVIRRRVFHPL
ncbi:hypothetical protein SCHPADRAFT_569957 [Schizopora paradoxa]|uniref:Uncharacterized protein n=1 Tax=Schizopora paradoxa TaxID=27342 RepID=A0A0H2RCX4_9AGAM|nr:hypothetical protein SCHPADRAFT_569957 [Schizopora paradoxa]